MAVHHDEVMINANGIEICTDAYGNAKDPAILLIMGAGASMIIWEERFVAQLADGGRFVIRFDNRDVGRTTCWPLGEPTYSMQDMAEDAVAVLDHYGVEKACVVGASMGGMITQLVGLDHADRVRSLVPIMSSPDPAAVTAAMAGEPTTLSPPTAEVLAAAASGATLDWSDRAAVIDNRIQMFRILTGSAYPFDEVARRSIYEAELARARNLPSSQNHGLVVGNTERWLDRLGEITAPTLVIHGTADPILPFDHGQAIADAILGATLLTLPGVGHDIPEGIYPVVVPAILAVSG